MRKNVTPNAMVWLCFLLVFLVGGCSGEETVKQYGKGRVFTTTDDGYVLDDILFAPEYDSPTTKGYAVIFLKRQATAPVSFSAGSLVGGAAPIRPTSLVDLGLIVGDSTIPSRDISFMGNDEKAEFKGKAIFYFTLEKEREFPKQGVFTKKDNDAATPYQIDFSGIQITDSL